jgi:uncharacterized membrane protein/protein-disulfide isomerase
MTRWRRCWPWWRWALTGLSALALALTACLAWHYLSGRSAIGCGGSDGPGCDQVLNSRWSTVGGVLPVSGLAAGAYLAMLVASLSIGPATETSVRRLAWRAMLVLVGAAAGSAVWFTFVQKWIIGTFCPYCMATHITGLLLAALVIWRAPIEPDDDPTDMALTDPSSASRVSSSVPARNVARTSPRRLIGRWPAMALTLAGLALAGILAACQITFTPPPVYRGGESHQNLPAIDPHTAPLLGSPEAPNVVNLLFDYKCPHCQQLHFMLDEAIRRYDSKLAFALCPTPLNRHCNPSIPRDVDEFKDSCELAKVGLAVWVANRDAFTAFDNWMFSFESGDHWQSRGFDAARTKAVELVGQAKFEAAWTDPWIDQYLQTSIRIYANTIQSGNGAIPKLVFGSRWVIPEPNDAHDLVLILQNSLALPKP